MVLNPLATPVLEVVYVLVQVLPPMVQLAFTLSEHFVDLTQLAFDCVHVPVVPLQVIVTEPLCARGLVLVSVWESVSLPLGLAALQVLPSEPDHVLAPEGHCLLPSHDPPNPVSYTHLTLPTICSV